MIHAINSIVSIRHDGGTLESAQILSPVMGLADVPALGGFYTVKAQSRIFTISDRRIVLGAAARTVPVGGCDRAA